MPKISLRSILLLVTGAALLSAVVARAVVGDSWAIGVSAAFGWAAVAMLFHAAVYAASYGLSGLRPRAASPSRDGASGSPEESIG